jgi:hypothetical protein
LRKVLLLRYSSFLPSWKTPSITTCNCSLQLITVRYNRLTPKTVCHVNVLHSCTLTREYGKEAKPTTSALYPFVAVTWNGIEMRLASMLNGQLRNSKT